jgi:hypothetical protein
MVISSLSLHRAARPFEEWSDLLPNVMHYDIHPQAEVVKIDYHRSISWYGLEKLSL